jgi:hypothetical protein
MKYSLHAGGGRHHTFTPPPPCFKHEVRGASGRGEAKEGEGVSGRKGIKRKALSGTQFFQRIFTEEQSSVLLMSLCVWNEGNGEKNSRGKAELPVLSQEKK